MKRNAGQLQIEILDALDDEGKPMTVKQLLDAVIVNGPTSQGQVLADLKKLKASGKVVCLASFQPQEWALKPGYVHERGKAVTAPAAPPAPAAPVLRATPVIRPGGMVYHPRQLAGRPDVEVLRDLREAGKPVLLYGPPGTGKTSLIEAAYPDLITLAGDGDTAPGDLVGEYTQNDDGTFVWVNGPLVRAMLEGRCFFVDDCTLISPAVLAVLYPAMDGRGQITLTAHEGETIKAAEGFFVAGGHNPGVAGAILTEALSSRFAVHIQVTTDYQLARSLGVPAKAIAIASDLGAAQRRGECEWAPQMRELLALKGIAEVLGEFAAYYNLVSIAPEADRDLVAEVIRTHTTITPTSLSLGSQLPIAPTPPATTGDESEEDDDDQ